MGYTNYWTKKRSFTDDEWRRVKDEYEWLTEMGEEIIVDQSENKDEIMFNGMAIKGLDHETFYINKKNDQESFNFFILLHLHPVLRMHRRRDPYQRGPGSN